MSVQKIRTPKGLQYLSSLTKSSEKNSLLRKMQQFHRMHCALWSECVWSIVDAEDSSTKFILSDHPVTVYNQDCFPLSKWCRKDSDPGIWLNGTHTIFPLSIDKALILTNLSWVRNPYGNALKSRPHSQLLRNAMFKFTDIQTKRKLLEHEVVAINYIIKSRAKRYVAAAEESWLYPEEKLTYNRWDHIGTSYLLMPDPRSLTFSSEVIIGYDDNRSDAFDEYGRKPWHQDYKDKKLHDYEWNSFHAFRCEFSRILGPKRRGISFDFGHEIEEDSPKAHDSNLKRESIYKAKIHIKKKRKKRKK